MSGAGITLCNISAECWHVFWRTWAFAKSNVPESSSLPWSGSLGRSRSWICAPPNGSSASGVDNNWLVGSKIANSFANWFEAIWIP